MRAAIYCRISEDRTGQAAGVKRQEEDCRALVAGREWEVAGVFVDNDISASSGKRRPAYESMMDGVRAGAADVVVAWHPDRLHRRPTELESFIEDLEAAGSTVATVQAGEMDLGTPSGRLVARMLGAAARHEVELKAARQRRKHEELARAGSWKGGGTRPFGYADDRVTIRDDEAALVRETARRVLLGESLRSACTRWGEQGVRTPGDHPWRSSSLRRMLLSARIAGRREHRGVFTATAVWEPIIDLETHERLRRVLSDPHRLTNGGTSRRSYLLTGIAECALCGARLVARPRPTYRSYVCTRGPGLGGCGKIRVKAEPLEELVAEAIFAALDSPAFAAALRETDEPDGLAEAVAQDEAALEQLAVDHYSSKLIGRAEYLAARSAIQVRLDANRRTLAHRTGSDLLGVPSGAEAVRAAWNANDIVWRRALVRTVLESVSVGSAVPGRRRFDPGRVRLAWRA